MTRLDPALPTLALVLRHTAWLCGTTPEDVIAGRGETVDEARAIFAWLAFHVTEATPEAVGYSVALGAEAVDQLRDQVDLRRHAARDFRERLNEAALEIHCEAAGVRRSILRGSPDCNAALTARRILGGDRQVLTVPIVDLVHLAASYELLIQHVQAFKAADQALKVALYTPGEKPARQRRDRAERALVAAASPFSEAKQKVPA